MEDLSRRERDALKAIISLFDKLEYSPTVREIAAEMGLSSSSATFRYIESLEKKGYIKRQECKARALKVLRRA